MMIDDMDESVDRLMMMNLWTDIGDNESVDRLMMMNLWTDCMMMMMKSMKLWTD